MRFTKWPKKELFLAGPTREIPSGVEWDLFLNLTKSREWPCSEIFPIPLPFRTKPLLRNYYKYIFYFLEPASHYKQDGECLYGLCKCDADAAKCFAKYEDKYNKKFKFYPKIIC